MNDVIPHENKELLAQILGEVQKRTYIDVVRDIQQQITDQAELIEVPVVHHFAPGVYMRQMDAKAGTLIVSKMHRTEHLNVLLSGSLTVATENGIEYLKAPAVIKSMPGTKRIGYFHEDTSWMTVHPTNSTDLEEIEKQVIVPEEEIDQFLALLQSNCKEIG